MSPQLLIPKGWNITNGTILPDQDAEDYMNLYDYQGALLFVMGLLCVYGLAIFFLIISLIRKSRTELELVDHLRDFEAMRRASKRRIREQLSQREHSPSPEIYSGSRGPLPLDLAAGVRPSMQRRNPGVLRLMRAQKAVDIPEDDTEVPSATTSSLSLLRMQNTTSSSSTMTPPRSPLLTAYDGPIQPVVEESQTCLREASVPDHALLLHNNRQASRESYLTPISETAQLNLHEEEEFSSPPIYV